MDHSNLSYEKRSKLEARMRGSSARPDGTLVRESLDSDNEAGGTMHGGGGARAGASPLTGGGRRRTANDLDDQTRGSLQLTEEIPATPADQRKARAAAAREAGAGDAATTAAPPMQPSGTANKQGATTAQKRKAEESAVYMLPPGKAPALGRVLDFGAGATAAAKTTPPRAGAAGTGGKARQQQKLDGFLNPSPAAGTTAPATIAPAAAASALATADPHQQGDVPKLGAPLPRTASINGEGRVATTGGGGGGGGTSVSPLAKDEEGASALTILGYKHEITRLRQQLESQRREYESHLETTRAEKALAEAAAREKEDLLARAQHDASVGVEDGRARERWNEAARGLVLQLARRCSHAERTRTAQEIATKKGTLGTFGIQRMGTRVFDTWVEGFEYQVKRQRLKEIESEKAELEQQRKDLKKQSAPAPLLGRLVTDDVLKGKIDTLKKEEKRVLEAIEELDAEKKVFIREMKRFNDEMESETFHNSPRLNGRYVLTRLLGRGGFSEVFRAVDLQDMCEVAVKVHKVEAGWTNQRKMDYIRHTVREYEIHKALRHHRIAQLVDTFEIDCNTFATVMELCDGGDLDQTLRAYGHLSEKEAKNVIFQVLDGLVYLNDPGSNKPRVIHYDLKPANILFTSLMEVKISDFGLSKSYEDGQTLAGVEMTSPGAGTYWYLPPECFNISAMQQSRVSNKVDVWSVGIIMYQMLYGKRPFGDDQTQQDLMLNNTIPNLAVKGVTFPATPKVSQDAKDFIARCLSYDPLRRPDVVQAHADSFFSKK